MVKALTWNDITVQQFLDVYKVSKDTGSDEMTKVEKTVAILYNMSEKQVEELSMMEFGRRCREINFVLVGNIPEKPVKRIKVNGRRYAINYDPSKIKHRQYVELMHYGANPVENMHLVMASVVQPVTWYGRKLKNSADDHEAVASDMLQAKVIDVHNANVFFCKLYASLMENLRDYLVMQMTQTGKITTNKANEIVTASVNAMAGFIQQKNWQPLKV